MGNHSSVGRSKGADLGQFPGGGRGADGQPFTLQSRQGHTKAAQQPSLDDEPPVLKGPKDKENEDPVPHRPRPVVTQGNKKMLPFVIKWTGGGNNVAIAGTFNQWQKLTMVKSEKDFVAIVDLPKGSHQYKFYVDGEWKVSPVEATSNANANANNNNGNNNNNSNRNTNNNKATENNNNVINISETDFEEFETALLYDPNDPNKERSVTQSKERPGEGEEDEFGQEIPEYEQTSKIRGPPVLPPHLLQVILNKDTPISCEPTLLPEPNHVMLNHMYALSIRDGMMVLSTSNRYKKKCVTTLIYRPIE